MAEAIVLRGVTISADADGRLCLTELWKLASEPDSKKPMYWLRILATMELVKALSLNVSLTHNKKPIAAKRGRRGGGTYAHPILALAYAEYLEPALGVEVREIALRVYAGDVTVLDDFKRSYAEQLEEDGNRVMVREEVRRNNFDLNATLKGVGASHGAQFAQFHNHGYRGLYNELTEDDIHRRKRLKRNQRILDHMGSLELSANAFRTFLAQQYLKEYAVKDVRRACAVHHRLGQRVRSNFVEEGLTMPEDLPAVDSINVARKRLKHATVRRLAKA